MLLLAGGAALVVAGSKKKKKKAEEPAIDPGEAAIEDDPAQKVLPPIAKDTNEVVFSGDFSKFEIGAKWRFDTLDHWLNERRKDGMLMTKRREQGVLYELLIDNPRTFIGDLLGVSPNTAMWIYGGLWAVATVGVTAHAIGFAGAGARTVSTLGGTARALPAAVGAEQASAVAIAAAKTPRFKIFMANMRNTRAGIAQLRKQGIKPSAKMLSASGALGGAKAATSLGIGRAGMLMSQKSAAVGTGVALTALTEDGVPEGYSEDLAASAMEAAMEFAAEHSVKVGPGKVEFPMSSLPGTDENPAVQEFNKIIMDYIVRFQSSEFSA